MAHRRNVTSDQLSDSELSDSSESNDTSSEASSNSFESRKSSQSLEPARILKHTLQLPKGLCENMQIFNNFFSLETWECLPDHIKDQLKNYLPSFDGVTGDAKEEQCEANATVKKLFLNQITRFDSSPLIDFQKNLEDGNYRPEISRLRANIRKSQRREQRFQQCERVSRLAKSLAIARERLLRSTIKQEKINNKKKQKIDVATTTPQKLINSVASSRARKRYFEEISNLNDYVGLETVFSDDENSPNDSASILSKKMKRNQNSNQVIIIKFEHKIIID